MWDTYKKSVSGLKWREVFKSKRSSRWVWAICVFLSTVEVGFGMLSGTDCSLRDHDHDNDVIVSVRQMVQSSGFLDCFWTGIFLFKGMGTSDRDRDRD
jgi:hypothetical protein